MPEERVKILAVSAKNVKCVREVEINTSGEITEICGDAGQGKTTVLDAIEGALTGLDPNMVTRGADHAEIIITTTRAQFERIVYPDGREKVTASVAGQKLAQAKSFLKTLFGDRGIFHPLEFVRLGTGEAKGQTDRLRRQREMLLAALPATITREDISKAAADSGIEIAIPPSHPMDGHALSVCDSLRAIFYDQRTAANAEVKRCESMLASAPMPSEPCPTEPCEILSEKEKDADNLLQEARGALRAWESTKVQRENLEQEIKRLEETAPDVDDLDSEFHRVHGAIDENIAHIAALEKQLSSARKRSADLTIELHNIEAKQSQLNQVAEKRRILEQLNAAAGEKPDVEAAENAQAEASNARRLSQNHAAHKQAKTLVENAREEAAVLDATVTFFRDTLPRRIIESLQIPIEGLEISDVVRLNGIPLHQLGTSEQIKIAVLLAEFLNKTAGFVLIDGAESLGSKDRLALARVAHERGLQLIMTRVEPDAKPAPGKIVMREGRAV